MSKIRLTRAAIIAALYTVLTLAFSFISYGAVQFRISESMTLLPMIYPEAIPGLFIGCLVANIFGGNGIWDTLLGSLVTLLAAWFTWRYRFTWIAYASPIILNGLLVSAYLHILLNVPYWTLALSITVGQAVVILTLGILLLNSLKRYAKQNGNRAEAEQ